MPITAREAAYKALGAFRRDGAWPERALEAHTRELDPRDAALAMRILSGTVQNLTLCDYYIARFTGRKKIEPQVRDILRISVYQIIFMTKIPKSAAVNEGVALARRRANPKAAGFANAVLRKIADAADNDTLPEIMGDSIYESLSIKYSHPEWLVREMCDTLGADDAEALLCENNRDDIPITAQINHVVTDAAGALDSLKADGVDARPHPFLEGALELYAPGSVTALKAFKDGCIYIQDASARLAVTAAGVRPGDAVLDTCAAPGGKSFAAAIAMENRGKLLSCDVYEKKLRLIDSGASRLGISIITTRVQDAAVYAGELAERFDVIIADVPCSGLGVIRKKPEIRYKTRESMDGLPTLQLSILENVARYVRPGGVLLYSTCTVLKRENEDVARAFLAAHPEFSVESFTLPGTIGAVPGGMITLWPHIHGTDGFFICRMRKAE